MSWTASIVSVTKTASGNAQISVQYSDGGSSGFTETYGFSTPSDAALHNTIKSRVAALDAVEAWCPTVQIGPVDLEVTAEVGAGSGTGTGVVVPEPDPAAEALRAFQDAARQLLQYHAAIQLGLVDSNDAGYLAAKQDARSKFTTDYLTTLPSPMM